MFTKFYFFKQIDKTIPQVAIRWLLQKDVVPSVIIGASCLQQLEDNMGASHGWRLSKDQVKTCII